LPYQHHLAALRTVIDAQRPDTWKASLYNGWLAALRELSNPTTTPEYPEAMRTRSWAMKTLNTQLASWTQLRHDNILYAKPSYTPPAGCSYPDGFVEPVPGFWQKMSELADLGASLSSNLTFQVTNYVQPRVQGDPGYFVSSDDLRKRIHSCMTNFSAKMKILKEISEKELRQEPLSTAESAFLQNLITYQGTFYEPVTKYNGWYPGLYFPATAMLTQQGSGKGLAAWDALVADVHSDAPDDLTGDPGGILHEGVGNVNLLMIAVDNGPDRAIYAGPVLSHFEFTTPWPQRLTDAAWKNRVAGGAQPPNPEWTRSYLAPK
jgi:hypothetical protein